MITELHLHHFRQHKDLHLNFADGITTIRGTNEAGKSTLFEAITFALFGVKSCRNNDLTTWGEKENSHKVSVTLNIADKAYKITRSKASAEVAFDDGYVSGQNEVTRYCEEILQLKPNTSGKLMFVAQNAIRGVLEETGAKTSQMIEQLAEFDQIDLWIDTLQTQFGTGKTDLLEQTLQQIQDESRTTDDWLRNNPDPSPAYESRKQELANQEKVLRQEVKQQEQNLQEAHQKLLALQEKGKQHQQLALQISEHKQSTQLRETLLQQGLPDVRESELQTAKERLHTLQTQMSLYQDYQSAADFRPVNVLQMSRQQAQNELATWQNELNAKRDSVAQLKAQIQHLHGQKHDSLTCPTCKRDWDNAEQMQQANADLEQQIQAIEQQLQTKQADVPNLENHIQQLQTLLNIAEPKLADGTKWQKDESCTPALYTWTGGEVVEVHQREVNQAQADVMNVERRLQDLQVANRKRQDARDELNELRLALSDLEQALKVLAYDAQAETQVNQIFQDLRLSLQSSQMRLNNVAQEKQQADEHFQLQQKMFTSMVERMRSLQTRKRESEAQMRELKTNNALLKALRNIKPQIANQLWQTLCSSISQYFSTLRGVSSQVDKGENGFTADGKEVSSLSGSTQDILGIAIRIALSKTFMPQSKFLLLDEPFAACDSQRQAQCLGFIQSLGYQQIIIVTHEDLSESVAQQLIEL